MRLLMATVAYALQDHPHGLVAATSKIPLQDPAYNKPSYQQQQPQLQCSQTQNPGVKSTTHNYASAKQVPYNALPAPTGYQQPTLAPLEAYQRPTATIFSWQQLAGPASRW